MARWPQQTNTYMHMAAYVDGQRSEIRRMCEEENVTVALTLVF